LTMRLLDLAGRFGFGLLGCHIPLAPPRLCLPGKAKYWRSASLRLAMAATRRPSAIRRP
jgi:hypothetical protein